jgi:hypothetical protein
MTQPLTDKERQKIIRLLKSGESQGQTARKVGRSKMTISRIAKAEGIQSDVTAIKKAEAHRLAYGLERRLGLVGKGLDKAEALLEGIEDAAELQKWSVALGTLVDKARLETGQATSRGESSHRDLSGVPNKELEEFERILNGS